MILYTTQTIEQTEHINKANTVTILSKSVS